MATVRQIAEADHVTGLHDMAACGPSDNCGLCRKVEECPGCGEEYGNERELTRCFESHPCHYCGGQMDAREHWNLTPGAGMLWCGCKEE